MPRVEQPVSSLNMPRAKKSPSDPSAPPPVKLPPREVCDAICRRFLKENQNIEWRREMPKLYQLFKAYPDLAFWQKHELPFGLHKLNHMSWFESVEGKAHLESAYTLFRYNPPDSTQQSTLDIVKEATDTGKVDDEQPVSSLPLPPPPAYPDRPRTVADMLRDI